MNSNRYTNYKLTVAAGANGSQTFTGTEPRVIYVVPSAANAAHMILTPSSSVTNAGANDLLVPADGLQFEASRALDRISIHNSSGAGIDVYIAVLD